MDPLHITDRDELLELLAQHRHGKARIIDEAEMKEALKKRVRGQDHIVDDLCRFVRLQWGKGTTRQTDRESSVCWPSRNGENRTGEGSRRILVR